MGGEAVELRLRNEHGAAGTEDESGAGLVDVLRRRRGIKLVDEKGEVKGAGVGLVKSNEAILGVNDFFEGLMNMGEQLIEIGGLIEGVNDIGDDLALGFHAVKIGDVRVRDDDGVDGRIGEKTVAGGFEIAPGAILGTEAAAGLGDRAGKGSEFAKALAGGAEIVGMENGGDGQATELVGTITEDAGKTAAGVEDGAVGA